MLCVAAQRHFDLSFSFPNRMGRNRFVFFPSFFSILLLLHQRCECHDDGRGRIYSTEPAFLFRQG